ncbi:hypothetical protein TrVFT333_006743 [Trichoderma virens FT-333]|nr:hypothetical protein TrVFT333_006743 [Trichoderma virens FT-333]
MKFGKDGLPFVSLSTFYVVHAGKDQKRIMDPLTIIGAVAACSDIIKTIVRITTNLSKVRSRCSEGGRVAIDGCQAVMDALDQDILPLMEDSVRSRLRQFFLDTNSSLKEHDARLQSQISVLQLLLTAAYCQNISEQNALLQQHTSTQLLQKVQEDTTTIREQSTVREATSEQLSSRDYTQDVGGATWGGESLGHGTIPALPQLSNPTHTWQRPLPFERLRNAEFVCPSEKTSYSMSIFSRMTSRSSPTGSSDSLSDQRKFWLTRKLSRHSVRLSPAGSTLPDHLLSPKSRKRIKVPGPLASTEMYLQSRHNTPPPKTIVAAQRGDLAEMTSLIRRRANLEQPHLGTGRTPLAVAAHCGHEGVVELLLTEGSNVRTKDKNQLEPLHLAAANGHCEIIDILLDREADMNVRGPDGKTPLRIACDHGQMNAIRALVRRQAMVDARDDQKRTPLHAASDSGDDDVVRLLLQSGANKDTKDFQMRSPLHCACSAGRIGVVKILLEAKADVEAQDDTKMTPLGIAAQSGLKLVAEILVQHKALAGVKSQGGMTPLHWASYQGHDEVVELLLKQKKVDIDARTDNNRTALHLAAMSRSFGAIEKLLRAGANIEAECSRNYRPLHYACVDTEYSEASLLLNFGANSSAKTTLGETPLHLAAKAESTATVRGLIERGASVDSQDAQGTRPLLIACSKGNLEIVQQLMENGAKLNVLLGPGLKGDAPVCMAASRGFVPVIQELINRGASAREVDSGGWQPLRHAAFMGHVSAVGCLLGNGARAIDLGPLDNLSFSSTASLDQMARIRELLDSAVRSEQLEYQHVTYLASSATPANADGPVELQSASRPPRQEIRRELLFAIRNYNPSTGAELHR